jgi:hypothetical protein
MSAAGAATIAAGVLALVSGVLLAIFFATGKVAWGRANDAASAAFALLLVPALITLHGRLEPVVGPVAFALTASGVAAVIGTTIFSALAALGRLSIGHITTWQGGSFGLLFAWVGLISLVGLVTDRLPTGVAWLGLVAMTFALIATIEVGRLVRRFGMDELARMTRPPLIAAGATLVALVAFPVWCVWLGLSL